MRSVAFSPNGEILASGNENGAVYLWDVMTRRYKAKPLPRATQIGINSVIFSPDGRTLASGSNEIIRLWDVVTGENKQTIKDTPSVSSVAFSPDGKTLASVGGNETIRLWDAVTGKQKDTLTRAYRLGQ